MITHLPIASTLESRDGGLGSDAGTKNSIVEKDGQSSALLKRPGVSNTNVPLAAGVAQGISTVNQATAIVVVGDNVVEVNTETDSIVATEAMLPLFSGQQVFINSKGGKNGHLVIKTDKEAWVYSP